MKIKRDQVAGIILMLLGVGVFYMISQFKKPFTAAYPGPSLMPGIAAFGLVVCGAGVFFQSLKNSKKEEPWMSKAAWIRMIVTFVVLCVYVFAMKYLGFLVVTPFVTFFLVSYFAKESGYEVALWKRIVFSVVVTAVIYGMYVPLFGMSLPSGLLFE